MARQCGNGLEQLGSWPYRAWRCPTHGENWRRPPDGLVPALVEALEAALPIVECEETRQDILLKCTEMEGATEEQKRLREKHIRGKRREAWRARKAIEAALAALDKAKGGGE